MTVYASDIIYEHVPDLFVLFWVLGTILALVSSFLTIFLMREHFVLGTSSAGIMSTEANFTLRILIVHPIFVVSAFITLWYPDMGYFFQFLQTAYLSAAIWYLIGYAVFCLGGPLKFLEHITSITPQRKWHSFPMCCIWGWCRLCARSDEETGTKYSEETDTFCSNARHTPQYADVLGKIKWFILQFVLLAPIIEFILLAVVGHTNGSSEYSLIVCSTLTWLSTLIGWYGLSTVFGWMRTIELTYNADLHENDSLMLGDIDDDYDPRDGGLRGSEISKSHSDVGVGAGGSAAEEDNVGDKDDNATGVRPTLRQGEAVQENDIQLVEEEGCCGKCCTACTSNTQLCWDVLLEKIFREIPNSFGEQFCVRRKMFWISTYFILTLTLTGFLRLFMPKLVVKSGVWLNEEQMCHAWTAFIVLCTSLPLALMAWFAFPVSAIPEEKEPMKNLGSRVIRGPNPRPYPPEGVLVDQLSTIIPTLDDHALSKAAGGLNVERDPSAISAHVGRKVDML